MKQIKQFIQKLPCYLGLHKKDEYVGMCTKVTRGADGIRYFVYYETYLCNTCNKEHKHVIDSTYSY